jgi:hypothetical protein
MSDEEDPRVGTPSEHSERDQTIETIDHDPTVEREPSAGPSNNERADSHPELSKLTKAELVSMLRRQDRIMDTILARETNPAPAPVTISKPRTLKMRDPQRFCGGAKELDIFLGHLRDNFRNHAELFTSDSTKVSYAIGLMGTFAEHARSEMHNTRATDPSEWANSLRQTNDPCLFDYEKFEDEIKRLYGDKERESRAAGRAIDEYAQGHHDKEETVRMYEQRTKALWREAGWTGQSNGHRILYDLAWHGLRKGLRRQIKPLAPLNGRFANLQSLFDKAADAEVLPDKKPANNPNNSSNPSNSSNPGTEQSSGQPTGRGRGKKRPHRSSTDKPNPGPPTSFPVTPTKPRAAWVRKEEFDRRIREKLCTRCAKSGHDSRDCPIFARPIHPDAEGGQNKKPRTSNNQSSSTSNTNTSANTESKN